MDGFEQVVSEILWMSGFWVRTSVKVEVTKEEKCLIGRHSSPRWELDIVGYSGWENLLRIVECKSFLDSTGVKACAFDGSDPEEAKRYKLFNESELRRVVSNRLCLQFTETGLCREAPEVRLSLACGKIKNDADRAKTRAHFEAHGWDLWDEPWLRERLRQMAEQGYENQVSAVVGKLLLRGKVD
jgi:hypothetical protein